jgi:hypothetical protein
MKSVYKLTMNFSVQSSTVYVKSDSPSKAVEFLKSKYSGAEVVFEKQVDFQHSFDYEV